LDIEGAAEVLKQILDLDSGNGKYYEITKIFVPEKQQEVDYVKLFPNSNVIVMDKASKIDPNIINEFAYLLFSGWSWKIDKEIYEKIPCIIYHISPAPKYRGGSPIQHQILAGEKTSAVTLLRAVEKFDSGKIYAQEEISLKGKLKDIFDEIVRGSVIGTIKMFKGLYEETLVPHTQDESKATYCKRRKPSDSEITKQDLVTKNSEQIYDFVRALQDPYPNAFVKCLEGSILLLKDADLVYDSGDVESNVRGSDRIDRYVELKLEDFANKSAEELSIMINDKNKIVYFVCSDGKKIYFVKSDINNKN